ncbi:MAG: class II aldolase/adducin family protein [Thermoplasmatota archaeon]
MADLKDFISRISEVSRIMSSRGWSSGIFGNISILLGPMEVGPAPVSFVFETGLFLPQLEGSLVMMTRSGSELSDIPDSPEDNLGLYGIGKGGGTMSLLWGEGAPTSEYLTHLLIYGYGEGKVGAVIHAHLEEVELLERELMDLAPDLPEWIGWVPKLPPGSMDLARATVQEMRRYDIMLWHGHGIIAPGKDLEDSLGRLERFHEWARSTLEPDSNR